VSNDSPESDKAAAESKGVVSRLVIGPTEPLEERGYAVAGIQAPSVRAAEQKATDDRTKRDQEWEPNPDEGGIRPAEPDALAPRPQAGLVEDRRLPPDDRTAGTSDTGDAGSAGVLKTRTDGSWIYYDVHTSVTACSRFSLEAFPQCCQLATPASINNGRGAQIVELRGWLRAVDRVPNLADDPADWHYDLELDPDWAARLGIDLNQLMRPGSILLHNRSDGDSFGQIRNVGAFPRDPDNVAISPALVHVELMSWRPGQQFDQWEGRILGKRTVETPTGWTHVEPSDSRMITWPWDPRLPSDGDPVSLQVGDYVRMTGALVTDFPHGLGDRSWDNSSQTNSNPAHWTEMHPPDLIERVSPQKAHETTLCCVALFADHGVTQGDFSTLEFDLFPVNPPPDPLATLECREVIDNAFTNFRTIIGQNAGRGAAIEARRDHVHVSVGVQGQRALGAPGKYKALFRLRWVPGPPQVRARITPPSGTIRSGDSAQLTIAAEDWANGKSLAATVNIDNDTSSYPANTPFPYTFHGAAHRILVAASGHVAADIRYAVQLRAITVTVDPEPIPLGRAVTVTIEAVDTATNEPVAGQIVIDNKVIGIAGVPFTATFTRRRIVRVDPDTGERVVSWVYPGGYVRVGSPDYGDTRIDFGWPLDDD
jgi:hypothetical protein